MYLTFMTCYMYFIISIKYKYCVCVIRAVLHLCSVRNFEYRLISQTAYGLVGTELWQHLFQWLFIL